MDGRNPRPAGRNKMNGPLGTYFHDTVALCFNMAVDQLGPIAREAIVEQFGKRGIQPREIGSRFDEAARILVEKGTIGRMVVYKTLVEVCQEYSFPVDFTQGDSLGEKFVFLKERVLVDRMTPRHLRSEIREGHYMAPRYVSIFDSFAISPQRISS